ncbi:hypothetical protein EV121DRAFT_294226 [Schizophyllum commune]
MSPGTRPSASGTRHQRSSAPASSSTSSGWTFPRIRDARPKSTWSARPARRTRRRSAIFWLAASRRLTGVSRHALLDRQPRLPPDFIVAGRVSVLLSWIAATRRGPRSGRAARANDENKGAAKSKGAAKNTGAANNLNNAQARQQDFAGVA